MSMLFLALVLSLWTAPAHGEPSTPTMPAPSASATDASLPRRFELRPTWDDGLRFRIGTRRKPPGIPHLFPGTTWVSGRAGFRFHIDAADFADAGNVEPVESNVDLRRAFVNVGGDVHLRWPVRYYFEFGIIKEHHPYLDRGWFEIGKPGHLEVKVGAFYAPLGLEQLTSSNTIMFLERAQPVQAFAPGTKAGVQLSRGGAGHDVAWWLGAFTDTQRADAADGTDGPGRVVGRVVWTPSVLADAGTHRLVHLGIAGEYVYSDRSKVDYDATAESAWAPQLVDTGGIAASHAVVHGLELAVQRDNLLLQSEYLGSFVAKDHGAVDFFWGGYLAVGVLVTGEARPYDARRGAFGMPVPFVPFSFRERRWRGAWEMALRWSYLDLDSDGVAGGRDHAISLGLNWYWNQHFRVMADYGLTTVAGDKPDGTLHVFQTRLQLVY